jgi:alginate O-acetyltransferase complex protein AlgI
MLFNTTHFFVFLAVVLALFYALPRRFRKCLLLAASYFFYASWNPKFIALLLTLTAIDFTAGLWLARTAENSRRRAILIGSLAANLGFLGFFKYYNFAASNLALALGRPAHSFWLDIVLPLGISFHTFQSISYVVDVYRGEQQAVRNPIDYALFICFFPQLVAGPIVRARDFFRDLYDWHAPSAEDVSRGLFLIALGLTKKMAFADQFAAVANAYFVNPAANPGRLTAWCGVFAFGMQIYFDFSGYTDMAIGMAKLLGFHFPVNFRRPYLACSITDFWRRWHISLSTWLRDYLYIPLGGNRLGSWMTYRNLTITMLLGGMWHGASWNFLIWGGYHGALLSVERAIRGGSKEREGWTLLYPFQAVITFGLVLVGWVFFRSADLRQSVYVIDQMFVGGPGKMTLLPWHIGLVALALTVAIAEEKWEAVEWLMTAPAWAYAAGLAVMLFCLEVFGVIDASIPFIYFQF